MKHTLRPLFVLCFVSLISSCSTSTSHVKPSPRLGEGVLSKSQRSLRATKLLRQAQILTRKGDERGALKSYRGALRDYEALKDEAGQAAVYNDLGLMLYDAGSLEKAREMLTEALKHGLESKEDRLVVEARYNLGLVEYGRGDDRAAEAHLSEALSSVEARKDWEMMGLVFNARGNVRRRMNNLAQAIEDYEAARDVWERLARGSFAAVASMNLGYCYLLGGDGDKGISALRGAISTLEAEDDGRGSGLVVHLGALIRMAQADPSKAREKVLIILGRKVAEKVSPPH